MYIQLSHIKKQLNYRKTNRPFDTLPLGSAMKFRRRELGMTLQEAALDLTSVSYLSKLENNLIKPNMKYVKLYEKRLSSTFNQHGYDQDYKDQLTSVLLALLLNQEVNEDIIKLYDSKKDHQSYLFMFAYYVSKGELDNIKTYYESLKLYIPNFMDLEVHVFLTCVAQILFSEERYIDSNHTIALFPKLDNDNLVIETIELKYKLKCAFHLMRFIDIEHIYRDYISNLQTMHAFDLLYEANIQYLIYQARYKSINYIEESLNKSPSMNFEDKKYIQSICHYHRGNFEKAKALVEPYVERDERWLVLYLLSLDSLGSTEDIKRILKDKISKTFVNKTTALIVRHLYFKYLKEQDQLLTYLRELVSNQSLFTDNYQTKAYLYRDSASIFKQNFLYKEAHQVAQQGFIEHQLCLTSN